ncbi:MAG: AEC family transporter [Tetrasphaera sp.]
MTGVLDGFATIALVIAVGAALAHWRVLDMSVQRVLAHVAFHVGGPALMVTVMSRTDIHGMLSLNLVATVAGVAVPALAYAVAAHLIWRRGLGETVIGTFAASYVNAGNLGIPIATYVLGDAALVAPTLLLQLLILQPLGLTLLDVDRSGGGLAWRQVLRRPVTNPLTLGTLAGLILSLTDTTLPRPIAAPIALIGGLAIPAMLLAFGISLRLGPRFGGASLAELAYTAALKSLVQPLIAYAVARFALGMSGAAPLAVTVTSALPTAQNIFTHATRYQRAEALARDTILVTTIACLPITVLIAAALG